MSRTARAAFVDGEMIGYLPVTNAENVKYENTNVKAALDGKVDKSGDIMTGNLIISRNATTSELELGNNTTSKGLIILFSNNDKYEVLRSPDGMTANRNIYLPDASGTVALTSDMKWKEIATITCAYDVQKTQSVSKTNYSEILVEYGQKNDNQVFYGENITLPTIGERPTSPIWKYAGQIYQTYIFYNATTEILTLKNFDYSGDMLFRVYAR